MAQAIPEIKITDYERFWSKVDRKENKEECWLWTRDKNKRYGSFLMGRRSIDRMVVKPHRMAYALHYGVDPGEKHVLHRCDCDKCCNPYHLFLGTHADNMKDMVAKGRNRLPEINGVHYHGSLSPQFVQCVREMYHSGINAVRIGQMVGISEYRVRNIIKRKVYKYNYEPKIDESWHGLLPLSEPH